MFTHSRVTRFIALLMMTTLLFNLLPVPLVSAQEGGDDSQPPAATQEESSDSQLTTGDPAVSDENQPAASTQDESLDNQLAASRSKKVFLPTLMRSRVSINSPSGSPQNPYIGMWLSAAELAKLPTSGSAWSSLVDAANQSAGSPDIQNQDSDNDVYVLAKALVYARTGDSKYRNEVVSQLQKAIGTESGGRTLALGRNLVSYVIAADLINLPAANASVDQSFRSWLSKTLTETLDGRTLAGTHEERPNNWGTHAGASRAAVAWYLGDKAELDRTAAVFRGWLGDRAAYSSFTYGELDWQVNPSQPVGVNPKGSTKNGVNIDGAQPEEMRRGGEFTNPPTPTDYAWEALQGAMVQAIILHRAGYPVLQSADRALLRAVDYLYRINWKAEGDDDWQPWLVNYYYGTSYPTTNAGNGKNMGWTDWSHGTR